MPESSIVTASRRRLYCWDCKNSMNQVRKLFALLVVTIQKRERVPRRHYSEALQLATDYSSAWWTAFPTLWYDYTKATSHSGVIICVLHWKTETSCHFAYAHVPALDPGCMFSRGWGWYWLHVFPRLPISKTFSCRWHWLHVFPRKWHWFHVFPRKWHWLHIFPRLTSVICFLALGIGCTLELRVVFGSLRCCQYSDLV